MIWRKKFQERISRFSTRTLCTAQCENYGNSLSRIFDKNFVKATFLLKELVKSWFHKIFFRWERFSRFSTLWNGNCLSATYLVFLYFSLKASTLTKYFNERLHEMILVCTFFFTLWKTWISLSPEKCFIKWTIWIVTSLEKTLHSRNFCQNSVTVRVNFLNFHTVTVLVHRFTEYFVRRSSDDFLAKDTWN